MYASIGAQLQTKFLSPYVSSTRRHLARIYYRLHILMDKLLFLLNMGKIQVSAVNIFKVCGAFLKRYLVHQWSSFNFFTNRNHASQKRSNCYIFWFCWFNHQVPATGKKPLVHGNRNPLNSDIKTSIPFFWRSTIKVISCCSSFSPTYKIG
jgi:hypothetical protein